MPCARDIQSRPAAQGLQKKRQVSLNEIRFCQLAKSNLKLQKLKSEIFTSIYSENRRLQYTKTLPETVSKN